LVLAGSSIIAANGARPDFADFAITSPTRGFCQQAV
jgi:hypothetical protein